MKLLKAERTITVPRPMQLNSFAHLHSRRIHGGIVLVLIHLGALGVLLQCAALASSGALQTDVTPTCISVMLDIKDGAPQSLHGTVYFRREGTEDWRPAASLSHVVYSGQAKHSNEPREINRLTGSIMRLAPATTYEVEVSILERAETFRTVVTTRGLPRIVPFRRPIEVYDTADMAKVQQEVRPGDVVLLHAGDYVSWKVTSGGNAHNPVLYRPFGDGRVRFEQIRVHAGHVWLDGLEVGKGGIHGHYDFPAAIQNDVTVTRCSVTGALHAINAYGYDWFVADNTLVGHDPPPGSFSGEGIEFRGRGHVAAFNDISKVGDGLSYGDGNIDIHNNQIHDNTDDSIEPDYAWDNYRIWENRIWNAGPNGISFQPIQGGPWYILRNQITGTKYNPFKLRSGQGPRFVIGNTIVASKPVQKFDSLLDRGGIFANNFWHIGQPNRDNHIGYGQKPKVGEMRLWDYNCYDALQNKVYKLGGKNPQSFWAEGAERNSKVVAWKDVARNPEVEPRIGTDQPILPQKSGGLVDAGTSDSTVGLANLVGPYLGQAPDVGANELGLGFAWTGPRSFSQHMAYGIPAGWTVAAENDSVRYRELGFPKRVSNQRLVLSHETPLAFIVVSYLPLKPNRRWPYYDRVLAESSKAKPLVPVVHFRDGLSAVIIRQRLGDVAIAKFVGIRVDEGGILAVRGGVAESDLPSIQDDWFTFFRSLYYPWNL